MEKLSLQRQLALLEPKYLKPITVRERSIRRCILLLSVMALVMTGNIAFALSFPCEGTANTKDVKVRAKPATSAKVILKLNKGETITVTDETEKKSGVIWYQVETESGKTGYIISDYLSIADTERIDAAKNSSGAATMILSVKASCSNYNGVGKNWTQYYEWNGVQITDTRETRVVLAPNVEFSLYSRIREQDQNPDTNTEKTVYRPTEEEISKGFAVEQTISVSENTGKHKGKKAVWTVVFEFKQVQPFRDS